MKKAYFPVVLFLSMALVMLFGSVAAAATCAPKVDNFIIFVDQSGSMYMTYEKTKTLKMAAAKQIALDMNALIPEVGYKGGVDLFAPFQELQAPVVYNRAALGAALKTIKDKQAIFGRQTPMAPGIVSAEQAAVLAGLKGKTAVIMLSDGKSNLGADPVLAAKEVAEQHPQAVFYVISFAQPGVKDSKSIGGKALNPEEEKKGAEINRHIAQIGNGMLVEASSLYKNQAAMQKFVNDVFCAEAKPVAAVVEQKIVLRGIQFDFDKSNIKAEFQPILDEAVSTLQAKPAIKVVIAGYTDSVGTAQYNVVLSNQRAKAVYNYFVSKGIAAGRLQTVGNGMDDPIANNATADGRAMNRRVELQIVQ